jgi:heme-degrading monooxygenase HmoA
MIVRIVKMTFRPDAVPDFLEMFDGIKNAIAGFEGCRSLSLLQCTEPRNVLFTYSTWESPEHLDRYRASGLFGSTWKQTKTWFAAPAEAWSVDILELL